MDFFAETFVIRNLILVGVIILVTLLVRQLLFRFIPPLLARQSPLWIGILAKHRMLNYLSLSVPGFLLATFVQLTPDVNRNLASIVYRLALIYSIMMLMRALIALLRSYNDFYDRYYEFAKEVPIKTVIQTAEVLIVNVPTSALIRESFYNWRSMQSREARRVLRPYQTAIK